MVELKLFFKSLSSPSLYMLQRTTWEKYNPNDWERIGDNVISSVTMIWKFAFYISPFVVMFMYRRGYMNVEYMIFVSKIALGVSLIMVTSYCVRSYGRITNDRYKSFIENLEYSGEKSNLKAIKKYDFDFSAWPVEYEFQKGIKPTTHKKSWRNSLSTLIQSPCSIIGYLVLHTFGIRIIYPGSTTLLNFFLSNALMEGRRSLIENMNGERFKLKSSDGNIVDTMFVDKRSHRSEKSSILVVCSEGNAGFYENGIMATAIDAGFSVLGWNHPGFGCSTGMPYPSQEQNAIDTVMQFAIFKLEFTPENIILYGWSIGGYSTAWAAMQYPNVRCLILDATFDDILPLALNQMPEIIESIVKLTIRNFADLNVAHFLVEYSGPIKLIRRTEDEIICISPGEISTNRGNFLLKKLLKRRYPSLMTPDGESTLEDWLETSGSSRENLLAGFEFDASLSKALLEDYKHRYGPTFPYHNLGKESSEQMRISLLLYLAESYMVDYKSSHCTPLPSSLFHNLTTTI